MLSKFLSRNLMILNAKQKKNEIRSICDNLLRKVTSVRKENTRILVLLIQEASESFIKAKRKILAMIFS